MNNHARRFFFVNDFEHIFQRHRLKVQTIRCVVVSRHGLGVAVDHDGFVTIFAHSESGVHAAVIKFNALANAVRSAAEHHDFFVVGGFGFAFTSTHAKSVSVAFVARVHVSRVCRELSRTGVHAFVDRANVEGVTTCTHHMLCGLEQLGQATVGETFLLERTQLVSGDGFERCGFKFQFDLDDFFDLHQKPGVDLGQGKHLVYTQTHGKCIPHIPNALGAGLAQLFL